MASPLQKTREPTETPDTKLFKVTLVRIQSDSFHAELLSGAGGRGDACSQSFPHPSAVPGIHRVRGLGTTYEQIPIVTELGLRNTQNGLKMSFQCLLIECKFSFRE